MTCGFGKHAAHCRDGRKPRTFVDCKDTPPNTDRNLGGKEVLGAFQTTRCATYESFPPSRSTVSIRAETDQAGPGLDNRINLRSPPTRDDGEEAWTSSNQKHCEGSNFATV